MSEFWLSLLGFDASRIPPGAETHFVWTHAPTSWLAFLGVALLAGVLYLVWWLYRREMSVCPRRVRAVLAVLRMAVLAVLVLVFLGPALAVSLKRTLEPYVILLLDDSLSMGIRDAYDDETAARLAPVVSKGQPGPAKAAPGGPEAVARAAGVSLPADAGPPLPPPALSERRPEGRRDLEEAPAPLPLEGLSRAELVDQFLGRQDGAFLRSLRSKGRVRVLTFSEGLKVRDALALEEPPEEAPAEKPGLAQGPPIPPLVPAGAGTNLAKAVREGLKSLAGSPVAAIVLVTDGQNTGAEDPLAAADFAAAQGVPILAVGVGDPRKPRNIRVADVWAPETVFTGDPFLVQARIQAEGTGQGAAEVELVERRSGEGADAAEKVLERRSVPLQADGPETAVSFKHEPHAPGDLLYTVRVTPEPHELLAADNEKSAPVKVIQEQARVLLVAGSPGWDFRMVRTLLLRDKTINVSCWLQSIDLDMRQDGDTVIERLPNKAEELFQYDVAAFFDPDPSEFSEAWLEMLRKFVGDHAGGLVWVAGPKFTPRFLANYRTRAIGDLLPVRIGDAAETDAALLGKSTTRSWRMRVTADGVDHPLLGFEKEVEANRRTWDSLPGVYWTYPAIGPKPGAQVLLEHGDPRTRVRDQWRPLLVAGQYGAGRTLYLGFDGLWRWRKLGERTYDQFWVQAVRYLVEGRVMGSKKRGRITTDRDLYPVGGRILVTARLYNASFEPLAVSVVPVVMRGRPGSAPAESELRLVANQPGHYEGTLIAREVGTSEIEVALPDEKGGTPVRVSKPVTVETPRVEFADPRLNRALLADLAARSGGRYFELDTADAIPALVPDRRETVVVREKPRDLWDTWRLLALVAALLTAEWAVRKHYRLM